MKSTTLRRSNITKEKVAMLEALERYNHGHQNEDFYRQQNKIRELDALWQSFGLKQQRTEKAPQAYFISGFIVGVIVTLTIAIFIGLLFNISTPRDNSVTPITTKKVEKKSSAKFSFIPADSSNSKVAEEPVLSNEEYIVKEGDTLESIVIRFYGSFDMDKVKLIQNASKMANPNALSIGQKLIIPIGN